MVCTFEKVLVKYPAALVKPFPPAISKLTKYVDSHSWSIVLIIEDFIVVHRQQSFEWVSNYQQFRVFLQASCDFSLDVYRETLNTIFPLDTRSVNGIGKQEVVVYDRIVFVLAACFDQRTEPSAAARLRDIAVKHLMFVIHDKYYLALYSWPSRMWL